jgi:hypothetical protein
MPLKFKMVKMANFMLYIYYTVLKFFSAVGDIAQWYNTCLACWRSWVNPQSWKIFFQKKKTDGFQEIMTTRGNALLV